MTELRKTIDESVEFLRERVEGEIPVGIILGTGLGKLAEEIDVETTVPYEEIPHFPVSTVESHSGKLLFGTLAGKRVVAMQGRFHYYEGYTMRQIVHPVRVMKFLGVETLLVSNACGGMNPNYRKGDLMFIADHINLLGDNPLIGENDEELGPRFPDMSEPYSVELLALGERVALDLKIKTHRGVYVAVPGPNLETRAEYRFLRGIGADVVGMSTVPEDIAAVHMGMRVLGMSVITDECFPDALEPAKLEDILAAAGVAEPKMTAIMKEITRRL
ncbi:MAG: purine-nucleoside phosphorylase [Ignavibacteriales bacterium]|nr:purine-nucleoside phosphorylase [Ignavibacteriales bacterium]